MPKGIYPRTSYHRSINRLAHTGLKQSTATIQKRMQSLKGRVRPEEEVKKTTESLKRYYSNNPGISTGKNNPMFGKHLTQEQREKVRQAHIGLKMPSTTGSNHWNWKGGIARLPYPYEFNSELKDLIRERDNFTCQNCGLTQEEYLQTCQAKLDVHHKDKNKENNDPANLVALCKGCHSSII